MPAGLRLQSWARHTRRRLKDFAKAQNQALAWMKANKSGVATILENSFQLPAFVAKNYDAVDYTNFAITPKYLLPWAGPLYTSGQLKKKLTTKQVNALVYERLDRKRRTSNIEVNMWAGAERSSDRPTRFQTRKLELVRIMNGELMVEESDQSRQSAETGGAIFELRDVAVRLPSGGEPRTILEEHQSRRARR